MGASYARSMPRVARSSLVRLAAPSDAVSAAAVDRLGAASTTPGMLVVAPLPNAQPPITLTLELTPAGTETDVTIASSGGIDIPFFAWFFRPLVVVAQRRARAHAVDSLRAELEGGPEPAPVRSVVGLPPVAFTPEQATFIATASAATAIVSFAAALFGQLTSPISDTFGASDATIGVAFALTRLGALLFGMPVIVPV